jgi:hypothetical protein
VPPTTRISPADKSFLFDARRGRCRYVYEVKDGSSRSYRVKIRRPAHEYKRGYVELPGRFRTADAAAAAVVDYYRRVYGEDWKQKAFAPHGKRRRALVWPVEEDAGRWVAMAWVMGRKQLVERPGPRYWSATKGEAVDFVLAWCRRSFPLFGELVLMAGDGRAGPPRLKRLPRPKRGGTRPSPALFG